MNQERFEIGTSLVTCSMNRTENLLRSIVSWNEILELNEIIVVDWSSDNPIKIEDLPSPKNNKKITLIRVLNETKWILSQAFNLGISFAKYDKLLKIDADVELNKNFLKKHIVSDSCFYSGNWENAKCKNEIHLNGQLLCPTKKFLQINGYNERINTYGYDDTDLYNRLVNLGLIKYDLDYEYMNHIETLDEKRSESQNINVSERFSIADLFDNHEIDKKIIDELIWVPFPDTNENLRLFLETQINRIKCEKNPWTDVDQKSKWKIAQLNNIYQCERQK